MAGETSSYVFMLCVMAFAHAHIVTTPTVVLNFRDQKSNHEIHENVVPQKFGVICPFATNYNFNESTKVQNTRRRISPCSAFYAEDPLPVPSNNARR